MTCRDVVEFLMDYLSAELPPDDRALFDAHLAGRVTGLDVGGRRAGDRSAGCQHDNRRQRPLTRLRGKSDGRGNGCAAPGEADSEHERSKVAS